VGAFQNDGSHAMPTVAMSAQVDLLDNFVINDRRLAFFSSARTAPPARCTSAGSCIAVPPLVFIFFCWSRFRFVFDFAQVDAFAKCKFSKKSLQLCFMV